jgi:hypothetical protein
LDDGRIRINLDLDEVARGRFAAVTVRDTAGRAAQLAGLWAIAVAKPFLDVVDSGEVFVNAGWRGGDVVLLALAVAFGPPAVMVALEVLAARLTPSAGVWLHAVFVALVGTILAAYVLRQNVTLGGGTQSVVSLACGAALGFAVVRLEPVRLFLAFLAPASLLFVALFLLGSPVRHLVAPADRSDLSGPPPSVPVVLIVFDEFPTLSLLDRHGNLDAAGYPAFARLARDATWFRNHTTVADFTPSAVPAILTGRSQTGDRPASISAHPDNLLALFAARGRVQAHEAIHTRLCPRSACPLNRPADFPGRVTRLVPALAKLSLATFLPDGAYARLPATYPLARLEPRERALERVGSESRSAPPALHYEHVFLPHQAWTRLPSGRTYPAAGVQGRDFVPDLPAVPLNVGLPSFPELRWTGDRRRMTLVVQQHLAQVRYTDRLLGRALDRLRESGLYDRALIVVTADHGVSFEPGNDARRLSRRTAPGVVPVPLLVKRPRQREGTVSFRFTQSIDIAPTIAAETGMRLPWHAEGRSLFDASAPDRRVLRVNAVQSGDRFTFDARALERSLRREAARRGALFPRRGADRIFMPEPFSALVGRRAGELPAGPPSRVRVAFSGHDGRIDVGSGDTIPALIGGGLSGPGASGKPLAVAIDGRVAATTVSHRSVAGARFEAMIAESRLRPGRHDVELYEIVGAGNRPRLSPLPG